MKQVVEIFRDDMKNIGKNILVLGIVIALMFLPSLYAWINILSSWDPYGNTGGIQVGVANLDKGTNLNGKEINLGNKITDVLKKNKQLGWRFTSEKNTLKQVKKGNYYAAIIIPEDFSKDILSVLSKSPIEPEIEYYVNEKINAIAPKITAKGTSSIIDHVSKNFVKTASEAMFGLFNELGIKLEKDLPSIEALKQKIYWLENRLPEAKKTMNEVAGSIKKVDMVIGKAEDRIHSLQELANKKNELANQLKQYLQGIQADTDEVLPVIEGQLANAAQNAGQFRDVITQLKNNAGNDEVANTIADQGNLFLQKQRKGIRDLRDVFASLNAIEKNGSLQQELNAFNGLLGNLDKQTNLLAAYSPERYDQLVSFTNSNERILNRLRANYDGVTKPAIESIWANVKELVSKAVTTINTGEKALPEVMDLLEGTRNKIKSHTGEFEALQANYPQIEKKIINLAEKIRAFERTYNIKEIIDLLRTDIETESEFLSQPVRLKEHSLYPIPNYGSGMSPFYTVLSLWVGATIMVSMLSVSVDGQKEYKPYQIYLGRYGLFLFIGLFQALIVTFGNIFLLKTYIVSKGLFIIAALLSSLVFTLIVYTLVSVIGNIGKGIAIILMVLQVSSSGGTFPVQVTPSFFQHINPYLPFTYSISLMREAVGGVYWPVATRDLSILCVFLFATIFLGLLLKKPFHARTEAMMEKVHRNRIF